MAYDYDALYAKDPHALGEQTASIAKFIESLAISGARILDVGCGQRRDALPLARAGHDVTGVDLSPNGIADMCAEATSEGLNITSQVADITTYTPDGLFDMILIDRTLHMLDHIAANGWLILADETSNLPDFRATLEADPRSWTIARCAKGLLFAQSGG